MEIIPHDIIKLKEGINHDLLFLPEWAQKVWDNTLYHVVRRDQCIDGKIPIGIRGNVRGERFGCYIPIEWIDDVISPKILVQQQMWLNWSRATDFPFYVSTLNQLKQLLSQFDWGIGGSIGYELTSHIPTTKLTSDLDIIIYAPSKIDVVQCQMILEKSQLFPINIDYQIQNKKGAFHLQEYARGRLPILLKTDLGSILTYYIWELAR